jgi:hypothetical protein
MSIKSKLSIALALVALGFGSTAFAEEINVSGLVTSTTGTGYSRIPLGYDAQGKLHVINSGSLRVGRVTTHRGQDAFAARASAEPAYRGYNEFSSDQDRYFADYNEYPGEGR